LPRQN